MVRVDIYRYQYWYLHSVQILAITNWSRIHVPSHHYWLIWIKARTRPRDKEGKGFIGMVNLWKRSIFSMPQSTKRAKWKAPTPPHIDRMSPRLLPMILLMEIFASEYPGYDTWHQETETRGHWHSNWPAARNHPQPGHVTPGVATSIYPIPIFPNTAPGEFGLRLKM